jgi:resuscitation-promoting factor RpfB
VTYEHRHDLWNGSAQPHSPPTQLVQPSPPYPTIALPQAPSVHRNITETEAIPFATETVRDAFIARGTTVVRIAGVPGVKTLTYEVTFSNGVQTGRELISEQVTRAPITQLIAVGTKETLDDGKAAADYR